jgi:hypothetical protein
VSVRNLDQYRHVCAALGQQVHAVPQLQRAPDHLEPGGIRPDHAVAEGCRGGIGISGLQHADLGPDIRFQHGAARREAQPLRWRVVHPPECHGPFFGQALPSLLEAQGQAEGEDRIGTGGKGIAVEDLRGRDGDDAARRVEGGLEQRRLCAGQRNGRGTTGARQGQARHPVAGPVVFQDRDGHHARRGQTCHRHCLLLREGEA